MSNTDWGGLFGTVILGGMAMKMVDKMDSHEHEHHEHKEPKRKKKSMNNAYARENSVFGSSKHSPW